MIAKALDIGGVLVTRGAHVELPDRASKAEKLHKHNIQLPPLNNFPLGLAATGHFVEEVPIRKTSERMKGVASLAESAVHAPGRAVLAPIIAVIRDGVGPFAAWTRLGAIDRFPAHTIVFRRNV